VKRDKIQISLLFFHCFQKSQTQGSTLIQTYHAEILIKFFF
jgi:hypothetical protein